MSITQNKARAKSDYDMTYEAGKKAEYDAFWDVFQAYGERDDYQNAFCPVWTNEIFKPKYDICPVGAYAATYMFYLNLYNFNTGNVLDIQEGLNYNGVVLDFSKATSLANTFDRAKITNLPPMDLQSCTQMGRTFYNCQITKVTLNNIRADCVFTLTFNYCSNLTELIVTGTIGQNGFNVQWSINLSKASITSIVNALSATTTGLTVTLALKAVDIAFETSEGACDGSTSDEWLALVATKSNWTIALSDA